MRFRSSILEHFNVRLKEYRGDDFKRRASYLLEGLRERLFMALVGGPGTGKKTLARYVMDAAKADMTIIYLQVLDDARITISQIIAAMIEALSFGGERPRRDVYAKKTQLARLLGRTVSKGRGVALVVEQAQHLHHNTIRAIKELRELSFLGDSELFSVLLMGHKSLEGKLLNLGDVAARVEFVRLDGATGWMDLEGRVAYIKGRFGAALTDAMRRQVALAHHTPMEIDRAIYERMQEAYRRGDRLQLSDFILDVKDVIEKAGLSYARVAEESGLSKATVSQVVNHKYDQPETVDKVKSAVARIVGLQEKGVA